MRWKTTHTHPGALLRKTLEVFLRMFVHISVPACDQCRCLKLFFIGRPGSQLLEEMNAPFCSIIYGCEMNKKSPQSLVVIGCSLVPDGTPKPCYVLLTQEVKQKTCLSVTRSARCCLVRSPTAAGFPGCTAFGLFVEDMSSASS